MPAFSLKVSEGSAAFATVLLAAAYQRYWQQIPHLMLQRET